MSSIDRVMSLAEEYKKKKKNNTENTSIDRVEMLSEIMKSGDKNAITNYMNNTYNMPKTTGTTRSFEKEEELPWYKKILQKPEAFDDGYQFGDLTKTIGGTIGDIGTGITKGVVGVGESIGTGLASGVAQVADWIGQDDYADRVRNKIATEEAPLGKLLNKGQEAIDDYSVIGDTGDKVTETIGQIGSYVATGGIGGSGLATATMFGNAAGGTFKESYSKGANDWQAWTKAIGTGLIEAGTERLFGLFGKSGLDTGLANAVSNRISSGAGKILSRVGIQATGEAVEEFISYAGNYLLDNGLVDKIGKAEYDSNWNWEEIGEQMGVAFLASGILGGGSNVDSITNNMKSNNMNFKESVNETARQQDLQGQNELVTKEIEDLQKQLNKTKDVTKTQELQTELDWKQKQLNALQNNAPTITTDTNIQDEENELQVVQPNAQQITDKTYYHGTRGEFDTFDNSKIGQNYEGDWSSLGKGFYFSNDYNSAKEFGESSINDGEVTVKEAKLDIKKPFYVDDLSKVDSNVLADIQAKYGLGEVANGYALIDGLKKKGLDSTEVLKQYGYDGIIAEDEVMVFDASQIKTNKQDAKVEEVATNTEQEKPTQKLEERISGDKLLDAQDFIEEVKSVGANVDENGYVTVYHRTTPENAKMISETGTMKANEDGIFFSTSKNGENNSNYGESVVELKVPAENLELDDIFSDEASVKIPLKNKNEILNVSEYLVKSKENSQKSTQTDTPTQAEIDNLMNIRDNKSGSEYANAFFDLKKKYGDAKLNKALNEEYSKQKKAQKESTKEVTKQVEEAIEPVLELVNQVAEQVKTIQENMIPVSQNIVEQQRQDSMNSLMNEEPPVQSGLTELEQQEKALFDEFIEERGFDSLDEQSKARYRYFQEQNIEEIDTDETEAISPFEERDIKEVGKDRSVKAYQYENPEVKPFFKEEAEIMLYDLAERQEGKRFPVIGADGYTDHWTGQQRVLVEDLAEFKDEYNLKYSDIEKGLNNLIKDEGAENNAVSKRLEFLINDRLLKGYTAVDGTEIPPNQDYINFLKQKNITQYSEEAYNEWKKTLDGLEAPIETAPEPQKTVSEPQTLRVEENIPVKETKAKKQNTELTDTSINKQKQENKEYEKHTGIKTEKQDGGEKLTKILTDMPENVQESRVKEILETAGIKIIDKGFFVKNEALNYKNQTLEEDYNQIKHANREAVNMAMDGYTEWNIDTTKKRRKGRLQSKKVTKSIEGMLEPIKKNNATEDFYKYMYNQLNIDRMTLESRAGEKIKQLQNEFVEYATQEKSSQAVNKKRNEIQEKIKKLNKTENKILLNLTAEESQENVKQYENETSFKTAEEDTRAYINQLQDILVDAGILSSEQKANLNEIYPHYIPAYRNVGNQVINVNSFNNNIKPNDAVGKAKGGTQDILPLDHSLMVKTKQVIQSARVNKYLKNLKDTYAKNGELKVISTENQEVENAFEESTSTERISKTENGKYTATVYENGKKTVFEISRGQYEALKPSDIPVITTLNTFVDIKRALLTEYNLFFGLRNFMRDMPTAFLQSQKSLKWLSNVPEAVMQVAKKGQYYQYAQSLGAGNNDYIDMNKIGYADIMPINTNAEHKGNKFSRGWEAFKNWKGVKWISNFNSFIEQVPRMAEFITAVDSGKSGAGAIYAQDEVTVNFGKGGDWTKAADKNVTSFVNANMQGGYKIANVFRDAYAYDGGAKGVAKVLTKWAIAGGSMVALMGAMWDDDEDYEELSDYIKQNYYVIGKYGDGKFIKIPKGRTNAVIEQFFNSGASVIRGEKSVGEASTDLLKVIENNLAPNSLVESSIFAGLIQTFTNTSWYGEDIVPTRLQKEEAKDQYDETTDAFSIWLGQTFGISPYKANYLLDQSTGFLGDMILPLMTEQAETPIDNPVAETFLGQFYKDYTTDSTMKNQNITDIYSLTEEGSNLYVASHKTGAKDEDVLKYKYLSSVTASMNELYAEKRIIQNETGLSNSEKFEELRYVQRQIDDLAKNALEEYENIKKTSNYAAIGDKEYFLKNDTWTKVDKEEQEELNSLDMSIKDRSTYFNLKSQISDIKESDTEYKKSEIATLVRDSNLTDEQKAYIYGKNYSSDETLDMIVSSGISFNEYLNFASQEFVADKNSNGKSISGSRKNKIINYVNSLNLDIPQKAMLIRTEYKTFNDYNYDIVSYVDGLSIDYSDKVQILESLDMKVSADGTISW